MAYARFIGKRLLESIPVIVGVTLVVFLLIHLVPGDPARTLLGPRATPQAIAHLRTEYGLEASLFEQYGLYMSRLVTGDLGHSFTYGISTSELIWERLPVTLWLIVYATLLTCLIALPLGVVAASGPGRLRDHTVRFVSVAGLGLPSFWLGVLLIQYVAIQTGLFPAAGFGSGFTGHLQAMFLPSLTVAISLAPLVVRSLRSEMLDVLDSDYVATARSKGMPERQVLRLHVLRNALVPSATILAVNVGFFIGATMVVETVFGLPGLGDLLIQAINRRDFAVIQSVTLILALMVIAVNIVADIAQALLDPRVGTS